MGKLYPEIDAKLAQWIGAQQMFFVSTAPIALDGLINCSPKGTEGTFAVIDSQRVAYLDLTGSGIETVAHLRENGRIVIMFCSFEGPPKILRLHGRGSVHESGSAGYQALEDHFPAHPGARAIIEIAITRIADSCGYAVPHYDFVQQRDVLDKWTERKGDAALRDYRVQKNSRSIDGLPGLSQTD